MQQKTAASPGFERDTVTRSGNTILVLVLPPMPSDPFPCVALADRLIRCLHNPSTSDTVACSGYKRAYETCLVLCETNPDTCAAYARKVAPVTLTVVNAQ
jgi:hypothetical protein